MEWDQRSISVDDKQKITLLMSQNLSILRAKLGLSQTQLAEAIGVTRQTISSAERGIRKLRWSRLTSLLLFFAHNTDTRPLLTLLGILTPKMAASFQAVDLSKLGAQKKSSEDHGM